WSYWTKICTTDQISEEPVPYINFQMLHAYPEKQVQKNLRACLDYPRELSNPLEHFIDWLLWGFNSGDNFPNISEKTDDYWYRTFNLGLFYLEPADQWGELASEYLGRNNKLGFFSTPGNVVEMMVKMNFGSEPQHKHKALSVLDPCCGTGIMLLYASNYSLNLYGIDISPLLVKICKVNAFTYVPWMVYKPKSLTIFDRVITEIGLPSGVRIPHCNRCNNKSQSFLMDIQTNHEIRISDIGLITINKPKISTDLVKKKLKPENIKCAHCEKEE
ncbi:MAG: N-6 DNA methylase, partial [Candidatus Hodarchaeales archaeon]